MSREEVQEGLPPTSFSILHHTESFHCYGDAWGSPLVISLCMQSLFYVAAGRRLVCDVEVKPWDPFSSRDKRKFSALNREDDDLSVIWTNKLH